MDGFYQDLTPAERTRYIHERACSLVAIAEQMGVSLRIERVPHFPLAMGNAGHRVEAWPARHQPQAQCAPAAPQQQLL